MRVKGLDQIVIRTGFQTSDDIFPAIFRRQKNEVHVGGSVSLTDFAADFHPIHPWHEPVEDRQRGRFCTLEDLPRLGSITGNDNLMPNLDQGGLQQPARNGVIVSNQDFHVTGSLLNTVNARARRAISLSSSAQAGSA